MLCRALNSNLHSFILFWTYLCCVLFVFASGLEILSGKSNVMWPPRVCPISTTCGGCQLYNTPYTEQLKRKANYVSSVLGSQGGFPSFDPLHVRPSPRLYNYRNRAQFAIQVNDLQRPVVGLYAKGTNKVVDTKVCEIQHHQVNAVLKAFRSFLHNNKVSVCNEQTGEGSLRHIVIRTAFATKDTMVCLVTATKNVAHLSAFVAAMKSVAHMRSIQLHYNPLPGDQVLLDTSDPSNKDYFTRILSGRDYLEEEVAGVKVRVSLRSFMQSNPIQAANLYRAVLDCISNSSQSNSSVQAIPLAPASTLAVPKRKVWDLYCGVGTIAIYMSKTGEFEHIFGVESCREAIRDAQHNAALNKVSSFVTFVQGRAEDVLRKQSTVATTGSVKIGTDDVVVLNPPRRGCEQSLLDALRLARPRTVIYVSCSLLTLARDLAILSAAADGGVGEDGGEGWYEVKDVQPIDMFPHTEHVETVVWLERVEKS